MTINGEVGRLMAESSLVLSVTSVIPSVTSFHRINVQKRQLLAISCYYNSVISRKVVA